MADFLLGFVLGTVMGSLVDCLAVRSLGKQSFWGRSYCDSCKKRLRWYDLFPLLSYILLRGRCRYCKDRISPETVIVEAFMGLAVGLIFLKSLPADFLLTLNASTTLLVVDVLFRVFVVCVLTILLITDLKKGLIPDRISRPATVIALLYLALLTLFKIYLQYSALKQSPLGQYLLPPYSDYFQRHVILTVEPFLFSLLSALGIAVFFGLVILITRGRGMGGGDLKLGFFIGLTLGFPTSILAIFLAFVLGSIAGLGLIISQKRHFGQTIPFGPFLTLGSVVALLWGSEIVNYYLMLRIS